MDAKFLRMFAELIHAKAENCCKFAEEAASEKNEGAKIAASAATLVLAGLCEAMNETADQLAKEPA